MSDAGVRVLKAASVAAVREQRVRADRDTADREREHQAAVMAAYARGVEEGIARAERDGAGGDLRGAEALERLCDAVDAAHLTETARTSRAVLAASLDIAEWILRHELPHDTRSVLARLDEAARALLPSVDVRVRVAPSDEAAVRCWAADRRGVQVVVDPALAPGDAEYDTDAGSVDVSVAAALRIAAEALGVDPARGPA